MQKREMTKEELQGALLREQKKTRLLGNRIADVEVTLADTQARLDTMTKAFQQRDKEARELEEKYNKEEKDGKPLPRNKQATKNAPVEHYGDKKNDKNRS